MTFDKDEMDDIMNTLMGRAPKKPPKTIKKR
jgi:hypothetical protein